MDRSVSPNRPAWLVVARADLDEVLARLRAIENRANAPELDREFILTMVSRAANVVRDVIALAA